MSFDLRCRSCRGRCTEWGSGTTGQHPTACHACRGTGEIDPIEATLDVARAHGTGIAAAWSGSSGPYIVKLRREADAYSRGRGHPTRAEMEAAKPRLHCPCLYCVDWRHAETRKPPDGMRLRPIVPGWRDHAACLEHDPALFFPEDEQSLANRGQIAAAKAICRTCPVLAECRDEILKDQSLSYTGCGVWAGLTATERRAIHARRRTEVA